MAVFGLIALVVIAWIFSHNRKKIDWRLVAACLVLQLIMALLALGIPALGISAPLGFLFEAANDGVNAFLAFTDEGSRFVFGSLMDEKAGFIFAVRVLPTIIFISALMSALYYMGLMQWIVHWIAVAMQKTLRTSGAESLSMAANIFVGQTEAPLLVKPYVSRMTKSEIFCVMVGGMANTAGGVLVAYVGMLRDRIPDIAGHLVTASFMSAPAAFLFSKMLFPETEKAVTSGRIPTEAETNPAANVIDALAIGASDGIKLAVNVAGMLLAFIAVIAMADGLLGVVGTWIHFSEWGASITPTVLLVKGEPVLSMSLILGWIFAPLAFLLGIPWQEAQVAGALLGQKVVLNEFVAYLNLTQFAQALSDRTIVIMSYALCGFANFSSIAIQIGGIGGMAPNKRGDLARMGLQAVLAGTLSTMMIAVFASFLI
jgi:concentrative nucleoside transporter, CNT family